MFAAVFWFNKSDTLPDWGYSLCHQNPDRRIQYTTVSCCWAGERQRVKWREEVWKRVGQKVRLSNCLACV